MSTSAHFIMYSIGKGGHVEKPLAPTLTLDPFYASSLSSNLIPPYWAMNPRGREAKTGICK